MNTKQTRSARKRTCRKRASGRLLHTQVSFEALDVALHAGVLTERERDVLMSRYGGRHGEKETLAALGTRYGISRERVRQIEQAALRKLRTAIAVSGSE